MSDEVCWVEVGSDLSTYWRPEVQCYSIASKALMQIMNINAKFAVRLHTNTYIYVGLILKCKFLSIFFN